MIEATLQDLERELWLRQRTSGLIKWKTRDGRHVPIKDMDMLHLLNTIKMLKHEKTILDAFREVL